MWLGSGLFLIAVAAPAAFRAAPDSTVAAAVVGAMLTRWHYIALAAPLALFALEWRRNRALVIALLFAALTFAAAQGMVDLRIRAIRESVMFGISALDPSDPLRRQFGMLHGVSMMLMATQVLIAAIVVAMNARKTVHVDDDVAASPTAAPAPYVPFSPEMHALHTVDVAPRSAVAPPEVPAAPAVAPATAPAIGDDDTDPGLEPRELPSAHHTDGGAQTVVSRVTDDDAPAVADDVHDDAAAPVVSDIREDDTYPPRSGEPR